VKSRVKSAVLTITGERKFEKEKKDNRYRPCLTEPFFEASRYRMRRTFRRPPRNSKTACWKWCSRFRYPSHGA